MFDIQSESRMKMELQKGHAKKDLPACVSRFNLC